MKSKKIYVRFHFISIDVIVAYVFYYESDADTCFSNYTYTSKVIFQKHLYVPSSLSLHFNIPIYFSTFSERYSIERYFVSRQYSDLLVDIFRKNEGSSRLINFDIVDSQAFLTKCALNNPFLSKRK